MIANTGYIHNKQQGFNNEIRRKTVMDSLSMQGEGILCSIIYVPRAGKKGGLKDIGR